MGLKNLLGIGTRGVTQNDSNVQDYVEGHKAANDNLPEKVNPRLEAAAKKLPDGVKAELDERLKRGTI